MKRLTAAAVFALALTAASCPKANDMEQRDKDRNELRPEGDPDRAVQWELDAARQAGTIAAYDLFLARNADHPLAAAARRERAEIASRRGK